MPPKKMKKTAMAPRPPKKKPTKDEKQMVAMGKMMPKKMMKKA